MASVLAILRDEHRSIAAILQAMECLLKEIQERGAKVDLKVFWSMIHYLDTFSERMHHPKEDEYLFKRVRAYWERMSKEEEQVLPAAEKALSAADWAAIDEAFERNRDPLAAERETRDFQRLFTRIVNLAPPPIGVGPAARR